MTATAELVSPQGNPDVRVRGFASLSDCNACVELQREIWGWEEADIVPASLLHVVEYVGGIAAGAFDPHGALLGFVFGISGVHEGELAHWSHMLGVRDSAQNMGVGRLLKEYQRRAMAKRNVKRIYWTFDPLMAKNAHFNFNRLRATVIDYIPDMYGITNSPLHYGLATDRLMVCVETAENRSTPVVLRWDGPPATMTPFPRPTDLVLEAGDEHPAVVLVEIPHDILEVIALTPDHARSWRSSVRDNFQWAIRNGYVTRAVHRDATGGRCFYVLARDGSSHRSSTE